MQFLTLLARSSALDLFKPAIPEATITVGKTIYKSQKPSELLGNPSEPDVIFQLHDFRNTFL